MDRTLSTTVNKRHAFRISTAVSLLFFELTPLRPCKMLAAVRELIMKKEIPFKVECIPVSLGFWPKSCYPRNPDAQNRMIKALQAPARLLAS